MPVAILSLCFSPLLDYCFIKKRALVAMETSTRKGQLAMYSSLYIVGRLSMRIVPPTVGNDGVFQDAVTHFHVCFKSRFCVLMWNWISQCFFDNHKSTHTEKYVARLCLKQEWISFIRPACVKRPRLEGSLPVKALDHRETLTSWPFHVARFTKSTHLFLIEHQRVVALIITGSFTVSVSSSSSSFGSSFLPTFQEWVSLEDLFLRLQTTHWCSGFSFFFLPVLYLLVSVWVSLGNIRNSKHFHYKTFSPRRLVNITGGK